MYFVYPFSEETAMRVQAGGNEEVLSMRRKMFLSSVLHYKEHTVQYRSTYAVATINGSGIKNSSRLKVMLTHEFTRATDIL